MNDEVHTFNDSYLFDYSLRLFDRLQKLKLVLESKAPLDLANNVTNVTCLPI